MNADPKPQRSPGEKQRPRAPDSEEPGTNAVEHEPDPKAQPLPDSHRKYVPRSPFTTGND